MLALELLAAFGAGGLVGVAIDSSWARGRGYEEGFNAATDVSRSPTAQRIIAEQEELTRQFRRAGELEKAERERPTIPHGAQGHYCTPQCYGHPERRSAWDV